MGVAVGGKLRSNLTRRELRDLLIELLHLGRAGVSP